MVLEDHASPIAGYLKHKTSSYKLARYQRPYTQVPPLPVKFTKYYDSYDYQVRKHLLANLLTNWNADLLRLEIL